MDDLTHSNFNRAAVKQIDSENLVLQGKSTYSRYVFNIYELSLFLKQKTSDPSQIINSDETKFAQMKFLRSLDSKTLQDSFRQNFDDNCAPQCSLLKNQSEEFIKSIPDISNNEIIEFTFYPDRTLVALAQKEPLIFSGNGLGKVFLRSWIGDNPPSSRFKSELLGETQNN